MSAIWPDQPPDDQIHLFVKLPASGEQKASLQLEHHLKSCFPFLHCSPMPHPASRSLVDPMAKFFINIVLMPLNERGTGSHVMRTKVRASARIFDLQYCIFSRLQADMFIGRDLHHDPPLYILPMKSMPTVDDLLRQDHAVLRKNAIPINRLPLDVVSNYFMVQDFDKIHFLAWLPPENGKSFHQIHPTSESA